MQSTLVTSIRSGSDGALTTGNPVPDGIDTTRPNVARIYDYLLGGKDNFTVDREAAKRLLEASPDMAGIVRDNRSFIGRVVRYLANDAGIIGAARLCHPTDQAMREKP